MRGKKAFLDDFIDFVLAVFFLVIAIVLVLLISKSGQENQMIKIDEAMHTLHTAETMDYYFQQQRLQEQIDQFQSPKTHEATLTNSSSTYFTQAYGDQWRIDFYNSSNKDPLFSIKNNRIITKSTSTYYLPLTEGGYLFINLYTGTPLSEDS